MIRKIMGLFGKVEQAKYVVIAPATQPNNTLQTSIFHQATGEIPPLKFVQLPTKVTINTTVDTSYLAETNKGQMYIPNTKDFYMGEG